jgi:hypothetical protein
VGGRALPLQNPCLAREAPDQPGTMDVAEARRGATGRRAHESDQKERENDPTVAPETATLAADCGR